MKITPFPFFFFAMFIQDAFREREKLFGTWQSAQMTLAKKREQEAKLKISGKPDKLAQVQEEIKDVRFQLPPRRDILPT